MAVMPRESWTDERLDDFRGEVNRRFDEVYRRFDETDRRIDETNRRIDETNQRMEEGFAAMRAEFQRVNDRLDALHHMLYRGMIALIVGLLIVMATFALQS